jgi:GNAT superfamily N-acetyltransferase
MTWFKKISGSPQMSYADALRVLGFPLGYAPSFEEVKLRYKTLSKQHHPDAGGDKLTFSRINNAKDVLISSPSVSSGANNKHSPYSTKDDFSDIGFCKRAIEDFSLQRGEVRPYQFTIFDGEFFRGGFTANCNDESLGFAAKVVARWSSESSNTFPLAAILCSKDMYIYRIIQIKGKDFSTQGIFIESEGDTANLLHKLKRLINRTDVSAKSLNWFKSAKSWAEKEGYNSDDHLHKLFSSSLSNIKITNENIEQVMSNPLEVFYIPSSKGRWTNNGQVFGTYWFFSKSRFYRVDAPVVDSQIMMSQGLACKILRVYDFVKGTTSQQNLGLIKANSPIEVMNKILNKIVEDRNSDNDDNDKTPEMEPPGPSGGLAQQNERELAYAQSNKDMSQIIIDSDYNIPRFGDDASDINRIEAYDKKTGQVVGYLNYFLTKKGVEIEMIFVASDYRNAGLATKMMQKLQSHYPDMEIDPGLTTRDGAAFFNRFKNKDKLTNIK